MTTQKPTSRALIKREREDDDSKESSFADLSETNPKRVPKGAQPRGHQRDSLAKVFIFKAALLSNI